MDIFPALLAWIYWAGCINVIRYIHSRGWWFFALYFNYRSGHQCDQLTSTASRSSVFDLWPEGCWLLMCNTLSGYASLNYQWWQTLVLVGGLGHKCRRCVGIGNQVSSLEIMGRVIVLDNNDGFLNRNVMLPLCTITQDNLSIIQLRVIDKMLLS